MKGNYEHLKWLHYLYQVWWHTSVIPATWEAKAGRSLELRSSGLQCIFKFINFCSPHFLFGEGAT
uniref:Uncharacterized protein n=1 Tax=Gopherus agassizii TaxID=38772 RepID=A0A452IVA5_9SAUR